MESYKIIVKKSVAKDLKEIPKKDVKRILSAKEIIAFSTPLRTTSLSYVWLKWGIAEMCTDRANRVQLINRSNPER